MKRYTTVLFDLDGTLTDTKPGIINCIKYALEKLGTRYDGDMEQFIGPPLRESFEIMTGRAELAELGVTYYRERYSTIGLFETEVFAGVPEMLDELKAFGYTLATATSKPEAFARRILERYDLAKYFTYIAGADFDGKRDKKHDVINYVVDVLHADREHTVLVGDRMHDLIGADQCGIDAVGVLYGYGSLEELSEFPNVYIAATPKNVAQFFTEGDFTD